MRWVRQATVAARFVLEVVALGLLCLWGFQAFAGPAASWALGLGAPLVLAVVWGLVASPQAPVALSPPMKVGVQVALLMLAAAALFHLGRPGLAGGFAVLVLVNALLLQVTERRDARSAPGLPTVR